MNWLKRIFGTTTTVTAPVPMPPRIKHLTHEEHRARHVQLHRAFDELLADWLRHQPLDRPQCVADTPIAVLIDWSYQQTINPTEPRDL